MNSFVKKVLILTTFLSLPTFVAADGVLANAARAYIDNPDLIAQGLQEVNFNPTRTNNPVNLSFTGGLEGQVWSSGLGWIQFSGTNYGVEIDCDSNTRTGTLSGLAWGSAAGWINFSPTNGGVSVDNNGVLDGQAWVQNAGWLVFDKDAGESNLGYVQFDFQCPKKGSSGTSKRIISFCKDPKALNYNSSSFGRHNPSMCQYENSTQIISDEQDDTYTICEPYLTEFIEFGKLNNPNEVQKLERFLNEKQGENLAVDGIYSKEDVEAVKRFQKKYRKEILDIWGLSNPTGYVYKTTKLKINSFYCNQSLSCPVFKEYNSLEKNENTYSDEVKTTKGLLSDLGFYTGAIDRQFDASLDTALTNFQEEFSATMLKPWGLKKGTGYKYKTTNKFLNFLVGCDTPAVYLEGIGEFDY